MFLLLLGPCFVFRILARHQFKKKKKRTAHFCIRHLRSAELPASMLSSPSSSPTPAGGGYGGRGWGIPEASSVTAAAHVGTRATVANPPLKVVLLVNVGHPQNAYPNHGPSSRKSIRVLLCAARTLNDTRESWGTLSPPWGARSRAARQPHTEGGKGRFIPSAPNTMPGFSRVCRPLGWPELKQEPLGPSGTLDTDHLGLTRPWA